MDNRPDLAVINADNNTVSVFRNTSTTNAISFASKIDFPTGSLPYSISTGDLDGDGKSELVIANGNSGSVTVLKNISTTGNILFDRGRDIGVEETPVFVSVCDLDGDGKPDLATANYQSKQLQSTKT